MWHPSSWPLAFSQLNSRPPGTCVSSSRLAPQGHWENEARGSRDCGTRWYSSLRPIASPNLGREPWRVEAGRGKYLAAYTLPFVMCEVRQSASLSNRVAPRPGWFAKMLRSVGIANGGLQVRPGGLPPIPVSGTAPRSTSALGIHLTTYSQSDPTREPGKRLWTRIRPSNPVAMATDLQNAGFVVRPGSPPAFRRNPVQPSLPPPGEVRRNWRCYQLFAIPWSRGHLPEAGGLRDRKAGWHGWRAGTPEGRLAWMGVEGPKGWLA
jgi:hypothetical protein